MDPRRLRYAISMKQITETNSYEDLRGIVIDILLGKEALTYPANHYGHLVLGVTEVLLRRGAAFKDEGYISGTPRMQNQDVELVRDIFWDLFRQGMITLGSNDSNDSWPHFRLSHHARQTLAQQSPYRFHDTSSYLKMVKNEAPIILSETETYLQEATATYYADCLLSCCVMLGVAAEIEFLKMVEVGCANAAHATIFERINAERHLRAKITRFQGSLPLLPSSLLHVAGEDLVTHLNAIQSVLRVARNDAGHALATKLPMREHVYVFLQLFVPFVGHVTRLRQALI
jgi:hypothetical protein